jgi:geranylgeranyl pyrophosphate synthase
MDDYVRIALSKTASLFAWCTETGAWAAGFEDPSVAFTAGLELGKAFQMADDLADTFAWDPRNSEKETLMEFVDSAPPLPLVIGAENDPGVLSAWQKLDPFAPVLELQERSSELIASLRNPSWVKSCADRIDQSLETATQAFRQMQATESLRATVDLIRGLAEDGLDAARSKR